MELMLQMLRQIALIALYALDIILFFDAILSWFDFIDRDNMLIAFLDNVTEAVTMPFRRLLDHFAFARNFPLDLSFLLTVVTIGILIAVL